MALDLIIYSIGICTILAIILYFLSTIAFAERTFEDVIASQNSQLNEITSRSPNVPKEKKVKKQVTKKKSKTVKETEVVDNLSFENVGEKTTKMLQLEIDPEIINESDEATVSPTSTSKRSRKKKTHLKPILLNKDEMMNKTTEPALEAEETIHPDFFHPKDEIELKYFHEDSHEAVGKTKNDFHHTKKHEKEQKSVDQQKKLPEANNKGKQAKKTSNAVPEKNQVETKEIETKDHESKPLEHQEDHSIDLKRSLVLLEKQICEEKEHYALMQKSYGELSARFEHMQYQYSETEKSLVNQLSSLHQLSATKDQENLQLRNNLQQAASQQVVQQLSEEIANYKQQMKVFTDSIQQNVQEIQSLQRTNEQLKSEKIKLNQDIKHLRSKPDNEKLLEELRRDLHKEKREHENLSKANRSLEDRLNEFESFKTANQSMLKTKEEKIQELSKKFSDSDLEVNSLKKDLQIQCSQAEELHDKNKQLTDALKEAETSSLSQHDDSNVDSSSTFIVVEKTLCSSISSIRPMEQFSNNVDEWLEHVASELKAMKISFEESTDIHEKLKMEIETLNEKSNVQAKEIQGYKTSLKETESKLNDLQQLYDTEEGKWKEEFEKINKSVDTSSRSLNILEQEKNAVIAEKDAAIKELEQKVNKLSDDLEENCLKLSTSEKKVDSLNFVVEEKQTDLVALQLKLSQTDDELASKKSLADGDSKEKDSLNSHINDLTTTLNTQKTDFESVKNENSSLKQELEENNLAKNNLEKQCAELEQKIDEVTKDHSQILKLNSEEKQKHEELQAANETLATELESSKAELASSNAELVSSKAELVSSKADLASSKDELAKLKDDLNANQSKLQAINSIQNGSSDENKSEENSTVSQPTADVNTPNAEKV